MKINGLLLAGLLALGTTIAASQSATGGASRQTGQNAPAATSPQASAPDQQSPSANQAGTSAPMPGSSDNAALQSRIQDALRNEPTLGASHVTATVTDSGIDLSGTVGSTKDKQTAERIASSFDGNRQIKDSIVVTGAGHSDLAPNHPAMNNSGTGNAPNPAMNPNSSNPQK